MATETPTTESDSDDWLERFDPTVRPSVRMDLCFLSAVATYLLLTGNVEMLLIGAVGLMGMVLLGITIGLGFRWSRWKLFGASLKDLCCLQWESWRRRLRLRRMRLEMAREAERQMWDRFEASSRAAKR